MRKVVLGAVVSAAIAFSGVAASAASWNLVVAGAGTPQMYNLDNGNVLGLFGVVDAQVGDVITLDEINTGGELTGATILNAYYGDPIGDGAWQGAPTAFTALPSTGGVIEAMFNATSTSLHDSLWLEWAGGTLVLKRNNGNPHSNFTIGSANVLPGDPLAPVPLPAAAWMLLAGIGGLVTLARRRAA